MYVCLFVFVGGHLVQALPFVYAFFFGKIDNNNINHDVKTPHVMASLLVFPNEMSSFANNKYMKHHNKFDCCIRISCSCPDLNVQFEDMTICQS